MTKNENRRETEPKGIAVRLIHANEWNVHKPDESGPEFQGLVDSIGQNGMMHRVVVRPLTGDDYEIVDGHRRFDAALALGWDEVPCEVVYGLEDEDAQAMTVTANVQRLENDPLLEAACIQRMADAGKTYEQIAAVLGKDARYVARRARLCNLTKAWADWFGRMDGVGVDLMEFVAAHETELQTEVFKEFICEDDGTVDESAEIDEDDIRRQFETRLRKLEDAIFDIEEAGCANCPFNTLTHGWLFADPDNDGGRCEKAECYVRRWNEAVDAKIEALRKKRVEVKEARQKWDIPNSWGMTDRKTKTNTQPWVYTENGLKRLVWAEPRQEVASAPALTEEEKAEAKRVKAAHKAWVKNRTSGIAKIRSTLCGGDHAENAQMIVDQGDTFRTVMKNYFERMFGDRWISDDMCILIGEIVGFAELGATADELTALMSKDPAYTETTND